MAAKQMERSYDVVVVGAGIGGLSTALVLAERFDVALVVKRDLMESATRHAQGGIAAVQGCDDNYALHAEDTKKAGAGLCRPDDADGQGCSVGGAADKPPVWLLLLLALAIRRRK